MSARQDVFKYMESHPKAPLNEVLSSFPSVKETTIRRYYFESIKSSPQKTSTAKASTKTAKRKPSQKSKSTKAAVKVNLKQQITDFLNTNPDSQLKDLYQAFPNAQKGTVANYRRQWIKTTSADNEELSEVKRQEILDFLDRNPSLNISDLKKAFPEAVNKVVTIFRSWKASQEDQAEPTQQRDTLIAEKKGPQWMDKHKNTIARQKKIIEQQKTKIEALKSQLPRVKEKGLVQTIKQFLFDRLAKK